MTNQTYPMYTKEYLSSGGVLIIENIVKGVRKKTDVLREILMYMAYLDEDALLQSVCRNMADCGSHKKEA